MGKKKSIFRAITRVAVLLPSVFCAFMAAAQTSLPDLLTHVLETQDMKMGIKLYNEITEADLAQLPDSVLFDYHYLGGYINSEIPNHKKAIGHLLEAKRLCDTSLGTHSGVYMEIMRGLGDEYVELGQYEEALAIYQEGIVKSTYMRVAASHDFGNLIMGVQECYERMGWYNEIPAHLMDAWSFWNKDEKPLVAYTYYPLWCLHQFYRRYEMYDNAIRVSDEIVKFITEKEGPNYPILAEELYFRGNTLSDMGRTDDAIETYLKALLILESNKLEYNEEYSYNSILGNLLIALIKAERWDDSDIVLNKIKKYGTLMSNDDIYTSALTAIAFVLYNNGHYDRALKFNTELLGYPLSPERKQTADRQQEEILYSQEVLNAIPELVNVMNNNTVASDEWFDAAFKLTSAYFRKKETEKYMVLLDSMYQAVTSNSLARDEYLVAILGTLFNVSLDNANYNLALKYAKEEWKYVSTLQDVPERYKFDCINNVVVAKLKSNKLDGIYYDLDKAIELCRAVFGEESEAYAIQLHNRGRAFQLDGKYDEAKQNYLDAIALHTKVKGSPMAKTVQYLMETNNQITDAELDL